MSKKENVPEDLLNPLYDGITHINVYSRGMTQLGRDLTNFSKRPIEHPVYGHFDSLEGYWYWLGTGKRHSVLRRVWGYRAKALGKSFSRVENPTFKSDFIEGLKLKLAQHPDLRDALLATELPLTHYYFYGDPSNCKVVDAKQAAWVTEWLSKWRDSTRAAIG